MILSSKALSVNQASADVAAGVAAGYPSLLSLRAVVHPKNIADGALGLQADFSAWNGVRVIRLDIRAANSFKPLRTVFFGGIMSYGASAAVAGTAVNLLFVEAGIIGELRFIPGIGLSVELGPQYALSGADLLSSPFSFTASAGLVFWMDWL